MLALSTAYFTLRPQLPTGQAIAEEARVLGFPLLELEYRLDAGQLRQLRAAVRREEVRVCSVHHPLPRPDGVSPQEAHRERVRLSSPDRDERGAAVREARETLAWAEDLGARYAVFHLGAVDLPSGLDPGGLAALAREGRRESPEYEALRARVAEERERAARPFREAVLSSLDRVAGEALRRGLRVGLENRYHPEQIPTGPELALIFRELEGAPLGYWHDVGHAASLVTLGFLESVLTLPETFADRLLGVHLHDARGLDDHRPPGEGDQDFAALAPRIAAACLVLEIQPPASPLALAKAKIVLAEAGIPV
jgi:sugar phosphate isomerase/epimerase